MQHSKCAKFAACNILLLFILFIYFIYFHHLFFLCFLLDYKGFDLLYIHFLKTKIFCHSKMGGKAGATEHRRASQALCLSLLCQQLRGSSGL